MRYDRYQYLWPPRPAVAQGANVLALYESAGWWAQPKMNGDCLVVAISPDGEIITRGRHGDAPLKRWQPGEECQLLAGRVPAHEWYVFVAEVLHNRGVGVKNTVFIHDLLVDAGEYLVGRAFDERQRRLAEVVGHPWQLHIGPSDLADLTHAEPMPGIWLALNHRRGFRALWENRPSLAVEGLVLKNPHAQLKPCAREGSNGEWQVKFRYATDHLSF